MKKEMLINVRQPEESRIGVVEDGVDPPSLSLRAGGMQARAHQAFLLGDECHEDQRRVLEVATRDRGAGAEGSNAAEHDGTPRYAPTPNGTFGRR